MVPSARMSPVDAAFDADAGQRTHHRRIGNTLHAERQLGIPAKRFGNAEEFGQFCAFMCSAQASYFTGQNVLLDGGAYPGTY